MGAAAAAEIYYGGERTKGGAELGESSPEQMFPSCFKPQRQDIRQHLKEQLGTLPRCRRLNVPNYTHMLECAEEDRGARLPAHAGFQQELRGPLLSACWPSDVIVLNTERCFEKLPLLAGPSGACRFQHSYLQEPLSLY